jgi:hypothetical protein
MVNPKTIRDQIVTILTNANPQNEAFVSVKKWFKGRPPASRNPACPWGWVEWLGGEMKHDIGSVTTEIDDKFLIAVIDKHADAERAENSVMEFVGTIETSLQGEVLLGGLVSDSWIINREKEHLFEEDSSIMVAKITLSTRRWK